MERLERQSSQNEIAKRTINSRGAEMDGILDSVADGPNNLPPSGRLALGADAARTGLSRGHGGKEIGGDSIFREFAVGEAFHEEGLFEAAGFLFFSVGTRRCEGSIGCCADSAVDNCVDRFFVVIPSDLLDEGEPGTRETNFDSVEQVRANVRNLSVRRTHLCQSHGLAASFHAWFTRQQLANVWRLSASDQEAGGTAEG